MIILTGAAGFIGSATLAALNQAGYKDILAVDSFGSDQKWKNLIGKEFSDYQHKTDFLAALKNRSKKTKIDAIIHLGACSSTLETNVDYLMQNNYEYSIELAKYCAEAKIPLIYASSAATYGDGKNGFSDENPINELAPLNPYGFSKHCFDLWLLKNGLSDRFVGIKFFNVFGPNEYHKAGMRSMVLKGYEQISSEKVMKLYKSNTAEFSDGGQMRDFIYIKDCSKVILWFLKNPKVSGLFNLGTGKARSWNDLSNAIFKALNLEPKIEYVDMPAELARQYQNFTEAPISKLRKAGFSEEFLSLEDSITDYVQNYLLKLDTNSGHAHAGYL
jgi:ADP-L-glycero-D-manno-heptose 6-epimerase